MTRERTPRRFDRTKVPDFRSLRDGCPSMAFEHGGIIPCSIQPKKRSLIRLRMCDYKASVPNNRPGNPYEKELPYCVMMQKDLTGSSPVRSPNSPVSKLSISRKLRGCPKTGRAYAHPVFGHLPIVSCFTETLFISLFHSTILIGKAFSCPSAATLTLAATFCAMAVSAWAAGDSGLLTTMGLPLSPPTRTSASMGTLPKKGTCIESANCSPPPVPKMSMRVPSGSSR